MADAHTNLDGVALNAGDHVRDLSPCQKGGLLAAARGQLGFGQHGGLGGLQHAVQPAQDGEGEDDFAVVGLLVIATQQVSDGPDEGGEGLLVHAGRI